MEYEDVESKSLENYLLALEKVQPTSCYMVIPNVNVNGNKRDLKFLVDTGASHYAILDLKLKEEMKIETISSGSTKVGNGQSCKTFFSVPTSIEIQGLKLKEKIALMDLGECSFDGIFGKPFLDFIEHNAYERSFHFSIVNNAIDFLWLDDDGENTPTIPKHIIITGIPCTKEPDPQEPKEAVFFELTKTKDVSITEGSLLMRIDDHGNFILANDGSEYITVLDSFSYPNDSFFAATSNENEEDASTIVDNAVKQQDQADIIDINADITWKPQQPTESDSFRDDEVLNRVKTEQNDLKTLKQRGDKYGIDLVEIIKEHGQIFSDEVPTRVVPSRGDYDAKLNFKDPDDAHKPICKKVYRLAPDELKALAKMLREMLARGTIRPSNSPWGTPVFLVPKPGGGWRLCCDYRELNAKLIREAYAPPACDSLFDQMREAHIFSSHDATWGYHQLRWRAKDIPRTAIRTALGTFEFMVMNFGATSAPAQFQRLMEAILRPVLGKSALCFLDDITVYSKDVSSHLEHLREVYRLLGKNKIFLRLAKCYFFTEKVKFLGWIISKGKLEADKSKLKVIIDWPRPETKKEVRSFAGFCNFYKKLCRNFAGVMVPLFDLLKDEVPHNLGETWGSAQDAAFADMKKLMTSPPVIHMANPEWQYVVHVDASEKAVGAVLSQTDPNTNYNYVVEYYSKKLGDAQKNYAPGKLELLAIIVSLEHWKHYLKGAKQPVILYTDHRPLVYIRTTKNPSRMLMRWNDFLSQFDLDIKYIEGKNNIADALSRIPESDEPRTEIKVSEIDDQHPADGPDLQEINYVSLNSKIDQRSTADDAELLETANSLLAINEYAVLLSADVDVSIRTNIDYKLNSTIFEEINKRFGPFDVELFASDQNNHISNYYTEQNDAFSKSWSNQNCYGNCPFDDEFIFRVLRKSIDDSNASLDSETKHTFVLPDWQNAPWYKTCRNHFDVVKRIPTSTPNVFSQPRTDNMKPIIGDEQRSYAGPIRWPVIIVHRKTLPRDRSSSSSLFAARAAPVIQDFDFRGSDFVSGDISTDMFARLKLAMEQDNLFTRVKDKHASITFPQNFTIRDGLLFWRRFNNSSLYIPPSMPNLRKYIYSQCHGNPIVGHFGIKKTLDRIRRTYWWPGIVKDVKENISKCQICVTCKRSNEPKQRQIPHSIPDCPWETVFLDEVSGFPSSNGCDAIWVFVDKLSHMVHLVPIRKQGFTAEDLARVIFGTVFKLHGLPRKLVHDRDSRLVDAAIQNFFKLAGITQNISTAGHPQTDSTGESTVKLVIDILRQFVNVERDNWFELIPAVEFAINSAPGLAGYSPFEIVYQRQPTSVDNILTRMKLSADDSTGRALRGAIKLRQYGQVVHRVRNHLKRIAEAVANPRLVITRRLAETHFAVGDLVLLHKSSAGKLYAQDKLAPIWVGPFEVLEAHHPSYKLDLPQIMEIHSTIHVDNLKALPQLDVQPDETETEPEDFPTERLLRGRLIIQGHDMIQSEGIRVLMIQIRGFWKHAKELAARGHFEELYDYITTNNVGDRQSLVGRMVKIKQPGTASTLVDGIITKQFADKRRWDISARDSEKSGVYTRNDFILKNIKPGEQSQTTQTTQEEHRAFLLDKYKVIMKKKHRNYRYTVIELCCGKSKSFSSHFKRSFPNAEIVTVDIKKEYNPTHCVDIRDWNILEYYPKHHFDICWISTPCNEYSHAKTIGERDFVRADGIARAVIKILKDIQPTVWFWENPLAHLQKRPFMQTFNQFLQTTSYCKYDTPFMKPTGIYSNVDLQLLPKCSATTPCEAREILSRHAATAQSGPSKTGTPGTSPLISEQIPNKLVKHIIKLSTLTLRTLRAEKSFRPKREIKTLDENTVCLLFG